MTERSAHDRRRAPQLFAESKAVVQLVLPHGWVARINDLANERGINRSALIREAIAAMYFDNLHDGRTSGVTEHNGPRRAEEGA